ncbi:21338_t:CDS:1, partial [Gigaspora rosea]
GLTKIKICLEFEVLQKLIADIKTNLLQKLLDTPDRIDKQLKDALPFSLPLEDHRQIRAVAITLHQALTFDLLPETYIADNRTSLPAHPPS